MSWQVALIAALIKMIVGVGVVMASVPMVVWLERKVVADIQARVGPNRVGPFGLLQCFADGIKLLLKEAVTPEGVDRLLYFAAPIVVMIPALCVAAVIPFAGDLDVMGIRHHMVIADLPVAVLFVLALTSLSVYGIVLSGWSSNNKYSLLGGLRSSAQMVSYELPMGLAVVAALMIASGMTQGNVLSLSLRQIVETQGDGFWNWTAFNARFLFAGFFAMLAFYICGLAETNRAPFDLPEAETELVGGYHTEYGGMRFALFFLGEYAAMINVSAVTTTLFLGGWHSPYPEGLIGLHPGSILFALHGAFWFLSKVFSILVVYIWIRGTLPRLRYDQLMAFTWKGLMPFTLALVLVCAAILSIRYQLPAPPELVQATELPALTVPGNANGNPIQMPGGFAPGSGLNGMPSGLPPGLRTLPGGGLAPGRGGALPGGVGLGGASRRRTTSPLVPPSAPPSAPITAPPATTPGGSH